MSLIDDFKNAEKLVKAVMRDLPQTRADDKKLMAVVWAIQGFKMTKEQFKMFLRCLPAETITRARRKLHEQGIYLPNHHIVEQRSLLSNTFAKELISIKL